MAADAKTSFHDAASPRESESNFSATPTPKGYMETPTDHNKKINLGRDGPTSTTHASTPAQDFGEDMKKHVPQTPNIRKGLVPSLDMTRLGSIKEEDGGHTPDSKV